MTGNNWIEEDALRFEGFNDAQISQIEAAIIKAQALSELIEKNETDLTAGIAQAKQLNALAQKNMAALSQAETLIRELLPVAKMVLTVIKGRMS
jgi:hypothetical protein